MTSSNSEWLLPDDGTSSLLARRHQMFPSLSEEEIARIARFGEPRSCPDSPASRGQG